MNAMTKSSKNGGCGCGCGGAGSKSGGCGCGGGVPATLCACGGVGCATYSNQGFARPRFFAGQLLTEEDLQKMVDYVVGKNRLHNQRLWGDGVVCGLEVTCDPCGGGTVTVKPGYALDCCGNDLMLGCPQNLDINAMVRDLKRNLRDGQDCGDPCPPPKKKVLDPRAQNALTAAGTSAGSAAHLPGTTEPDADATEAILDTTRHYCLYIRYCENPSDPVSPYATDDGCSYQSCQNTRINEGVSFELRCDGGCEQQSTIFDRICECIGDLDSASQADKYARSFQSLTLLRAPVQDVELTDAVVAGRKAVEAIELLEQIQIPSVTATARAARPTKTAAAATGTTGVDQAAISVDEFEGLLSKIQTANAHLASYQLARTKATDSKELNEIDVLVSKAAARLNGTATTLKSRVAEVEAPELARGYYASALNQTTELASRKLNQEKLINIQKGQLLESSDFGTTPAAMKALREELLDRLDKSPRIGDCQLRSDVESIRIPESGQGAEWEKAGQSLQLAWNRYLKDCLCAAMNPPCVSCQDSAVLLACITVKDCKVVEICNLKRKFVISATALRYWLPQLSELGEELEKLCCPEPICIDKDSPTIGYVPNSLVGGTKAPGYFDFHIFEFLCRKRQKIEYTATDSQGKIGSVMSRTASAFSTVESIPWFPYGMDRTVESFNRSVGAVMKAESGAADAIAGLAETKVTTAIEKMTKATAKDAKEVSKLKTENVELKTKVKELTKQMTDLAKRVEKLGG